MESGFAQDGAMESKPLPKKRSLFTKTALSKTAEAEDAVAFFSRAKELQAERLAEDERRRQKKITKLERKRSSPTIERKETSPEGKRRRVSMHGGVESNSSPSSAGHEEQEEATWARRESTLSTPGSGPSKRPSSQNKAQASPTTLSERYSKSLQAEKSGSSKGDAAKGYISITDSDSEGATTALPGRTPAAQPIVLGDDDDYVAPRMVTPRRQEEDPQLSDEEFPELVQKARERERQRELQRANAAKSFQEQNHASNAIPDLVVDIFQVEPTTAEADPSIEILITSMMENTKPLMVRRKLSQRLQAVRHAWCDKQSQGQLAGADLKSVVFLTWRRKRLFDSTTCRALGLKIDGRGRLSSEEEGVDGGRVHLEAWTEETYNAFQEREAAKLRREQGESDEEVPVEQKEQVIKIRLIMKARDMDPFRLVVKPTTAIEKLMVAFRQSRAVPEEKDIALHFDGEKLDPSSTIEETELGEMDTVDVYIR